MENYHRKVAKFFFEMADVDIGGTPLHKHFEHSGESFYWTMEDQFYLNLNRKSNQTLQKALEFWSRTWAYSDFRGEKISDMKQCDTVFFNTSFDRSRRKIIGGFLSHHFSGLEEILKKRKIRHAEISYISSRGYSRTNPYEDFDYELRYPFNAFLDSHTYEAEKRMISKVQYFWKKHWDEMEAALQVPCKRFTRDTKKTMEVLKQCSERSLPEAVRSFEVIKRILKLSGAKVIVLIGHEDRYNIAAVMAARKDGVKTIELPHGFTSGLPSFDTRFPLPDKICMYGKRDLKRFNKDGNIPIEKLIITGHPRYDSVAEFINWGKKDDIKKKYGLDEKKNTILWIAQTHEPWMSKSGENEVNAEHVMSCFKKQVKCQLAIKLHPDEDQSGKLYHEYAKKTGIKIIVFDKKANTNELILASDAVIMKLSTVAVDTILIGKPLILLQFMKTHDLSELSDFGFHVVENDEQLISILNNIDKPEDKENFEKCRERYINEKVANFGHASEKVVDELRKLL